MHGGRWRLVELLCNVSHNTPSHCLRCACPCVCDVCVAHCVAVTHTCAKEIIVPAVSDIGVLVRICFSDGFMATLSSLTPTPVSDLHKHTHTHTHTHSKAYECGRKFWPDTFDLRADWWAIESMKHTNTLLSNAHHAIVLWGGGGGGGYRWFQWYKLPFSVGIDSPVLLPSPLPCGHRTPDTLSPGRTDTHTHTHTCTHTIWLWCTW